VGCSCLLAVRCAALHAALHAGAASPPVHPPSPTVRLALPPPALLPFPACAAMWDTAGFIPMPCRRPIEKNQGCMHMTCSQCRHEFCWLCEGSWAEHGERTGGFYNCNR
jgi:hypothetical protein